MGFCALELGFMKQKQQKKREWDFNLSNTGWDCGILSWDLKKKTISWEMGLEPPIQFLKQFAVSRNCEGLTENPR